MPSAAQGGARARGASVARLSRDRTYRLQCRSDIANFWLQYCIHDYLFLNMFFSCLVQLKCSWQSVGVANGKLELRCLSGLLCGDCCCSSAVIGTSQQHRVPATWNADAPQPWGFSVLPLPRSREGAESRAEGCSGLAKASISGPSSGLSLWWQIWWE